MKISACVITKNEEKVIKRCIDSFKLIVDEIILIDTGSTDNTVNIAAGLGADVYNYEWDNNFANAKNFALEKVSGDWIIFLDADEYFYEDTYKNLPNVLAQINDKKAIDAIKCKLVNTDGDDGPVIYTNPTVRIFRNDKSMRFVGNVHEVLKKEEKNITSIFVHEDFILIYHTGYASSRLKDKMKRNLVLLEQNLSEGKISGMTYYYLSECYAALEQYELAIKYSKLQLEKNDSGFDTTGFSSRPYIVIIGCMNYLRNKYSASDIEEIIYTAIEKFPNHPEFYKCLGELRVYEKKYSEGLEYLLKAVKLDEEYKDIEINSFKGHLGNVYGNIGLLYGLKNDINSALEYFIKSLKINKYAENSFKGLIKLIKNNTSEDIIGLLNSIYNKEKKEDLHFLVIKLSQFKLGKPLAYFYEIYSKNYNFKHYFIEAIILLSEGYYKKALELLASYYFQTKNEQAEQFIMVISLISNDSELANQLKGQFKPSYQKFIDYYFNGDNKILFDYTDFNEFLKILQEVIVIGDFRFLNNILNIKNAFKVNISLEMAELFIGYNIYDFAVSQLDEYVNLADVNKVEAYFKIGVCNFMLSKFTNSIAGFEQSIDYGYKENDIYEYLKWIKENNNAELLKQESTKINMSKPQDELPNKIISTKMTSIIILTFNQLDYTKLCIDSIRKYTNSEKYEIIIVDNCSTDGTVEWLNQQDNLRVVYNKENLGFPKGCNQGIEIAVGDSILLLNNDVIVTPNWIDNLNTCLWSSKDIGAVGAVTNSCSYYQGIPVPYSNIEGMIEFARGYNISDSTKWEQRIKLVGFCMLIKRSVIDKIGLLDERFTPGNFEDDDYSFRMIDAGYKLILCRDTFIHHFGSVSFKNNPVEFNNLLQLNEQKFKDKWGFNSAYSAAIRHEIVNRISNDKKDEINVLEVGCACGATLLHIKGLYENAHIYGVELDANVTKIAKKIAEVRCEDIEACNLSYEEEFFDYIIFGDVLEHLYNPWKVLKNIKVYLKPGGKILASIPNVMHFSILKGLLNGNWTYKDSGLLDKTHIRFFTLNEINKMFMEAGYKNIRYSALNQISSKDDELFIDSLCNMTGNINNKQQFIAFQYIAEAQKLTSVSNNCCDESEKLKDAFPLISILIPTYNRPKYFLLALESALKQSYENIEIIVGDDSTNNETEELMKKNYLGKYDNVKYYHNEKNLGQFDNDLKLFDMAEGEFINYLMDDDIFEHNKIAKMMNYFIQDKKEEISLVTSHRGIIDSNGNCVGIFGNTDKMFNRDTIIDGTQLGDFILMNNFNCIGEPTTVIFRKNKLIESFGMFNGRRYGCNVDQASWFNLLSKGNAVFMNEVLSYFRIHENQQLASNKMKLLGTADYAHEVLTASLKGFLLNKNNFVRALSSSLKLCETVISESKNLQKNQQYMSEYKELEEYYEKLREQLNNLRSV